MHALRPEPLAPTLLLGNMKTPPRNRGGSAERWGERFVAVVGVMLGLCVMASPAMSKTREPASRVRDSSNLRQIGQAGLIYASDHQDKLPGAAATDLWDYARLAALDGGFNDATVWAGSSDPATRGQYGELSTVLTKDRAGIHPEFRKLKPTWAVALGELHTGLPIDTPIAWTRGLLPDGTWAPHSPNGTEGGHVVFLGGHVAFFRNTRSAFLRFDGKEKCTDIRDALPPGARIAQYEPNAEEATAWARATRVRHAGSWIAEWKWTLVWLGIGATLLAQALRRRWPFAWFVWYLVLSLLAAIVTPTVS